MFLCIKKKTSDNQSQRRAIRSNYTVYTALLTSSGKLNTVSTTRGGCEVLSDAPDEFKGRSSLRLFELICDKKNTPMIRKVVWQQIVIQIKPIFFVFMRGMETNHVILLFFCYLYKRIIVLIAGVRDSKTLSLKTFDIRFN